MTEMIEGYCELCGVPFASRKGAVENRKRFCSRRCQQRSNYIDNNEKRREAYRAKYNADEEFRLSKIQKLREYRAKVGDPRATRPSHDSKRPGRAR